jgi:putative flippase GtrA
MSVSVLIPAYNPDQRLCEFVAELRRQNACREIIVVDDGSRVSCRSIFNSLAQLPKVTVLRHAVNLGKGAALKTGFNYFCWACPQDIGVVTADADGQHLTEDVVNVAAQLHESPDKLVMGARAFDKDVPARSMFGNLMTRYMFWALIGMRLTDTQSGLRGIPTSFAAKLLRIKHTGYEFELEMLIKCKQLRIAIEECTIQTVYLDGNSSSHFNPLYDSLKIYLVLIRFMLASLATAAIDYAIFLVAYPIGGVLFGLGTARLVAGAVNFTLANRMVFASKEQVSSSLPKYVALVATIGLVSYGLIQGITSILSVGVLPAKLLAEGVLYMLNFLIQRDFIFRAPADLSASDADMQSGGLPLLRMTDTEDRKAA